MKIDEIKAFLDNKNTTVDQIIKYIQSAVDEFQEKAIQIHITALEKEIKHSDAESIDLDEHAADILKIVQTEVLNFIETQCTKITDDVLDLINEHQVDDHSAYNFIAILNTVKDVFKETRH